MEHRASSGVLEAANDLGERLVVVAQLAQTRGPKGEVVEHRVRRPPRHRRCVGGSSALELGCGNGAVLGAFLDQGFLLNGTGLDLDMSRFTTASTNPKLKFIAGDVNKVELRPNQYDLIYALQSFHHFDEIDHIMEQVHGALTPNGYFVLDEYVGPNRFQWTDLQLSVTSYLLCMLPKALRWYANGVEKQAEGRSTPAQVIAVCPSEALRSDEIVAAFNRHFDVVHHRKLGGTIQHILYSGIIQNFPDNDPATDQLIDSIDGIETAMIEHGMLPSDFAILIGRKRSA